MPEPKGNAGLGRLIWQTNRDAAACDLSGHFWAVAWPTDQNQRTVWSWMIIGYENQVLASGQTGDLGAAKRLVEEWDRWVSGPDAVLDRWENPVPVADNNDCRMYRPVWPDWPWPEAQSS